MIMWFKSRVVAQFQGYLLFYFSFYVAVWVLFSAGYIFYGFKLLSIIPYVMREKIVSVSHLQFVVVSRSFLEISPKFRLIEWQIMVLLAILAVCDVTAHVIGLVVLVSPFPDLRAFYVGQNFPGNFIWRVVDRQYKLCYIMGGKLCRRKYIYSSVAMAQVEFSWKFLIGLSLQRCSLTETDGSIRNWYTVWSPKEILIRVEVASRRKLILKARTWKWAELARSDVMIKII